MYPKAIQQVFNVHGKTSCMKTGIIALCLCAFFFILPLQCYIIGNDMGVGVQGAVFRYQMSSMGNSLIPITKELGYVASGTYEGRTAFSILFWAIGTTILSLITLLSLIYGNRLTPRHIRIITVGLGSSGLCYFISCFFQYGMFLSGPAGISLPIGVILMLLFALGFHFYKDFFFIEDSVPGT